MATTTCLPSSVTGAVTTIEDTVTAGMAVIVEVGTEAVIVEVGMAAMVEDGTGVWAGMAPFQSTEIESITVPIGAQGFIIVPVVTNAVNTIAMAESYDA